VMWPALAPGGREVWVRLNRENEKVSIDIGKFMC
jgi:hypothetical protein